MILNDDDDDDDDDDYYYYYIIIDDDDDVAIACRESRSERMLLSSRPYFFLRMEFAVSSA